MTHVPIFFILIAELLLLSSNSILNRILHPRSVTWNQSRFEHSPLPEIHFFSTAGRLPSARRGGAPFAACPAPARRGGGGVPSSHRRGSTLAARRHPIYIGLSLVAAPSHHSSQITGLLSICLCCPLCGSLLCSCQSGLLSVCICCSVLSFWYSGAAHKG